MPQKTERDKWWAFINGRPECEWNPTKKPKAPRNRHRRGMRSWSETHEGANQYEVQYEVDSRTAQEAIVIDEHGEIKVEEPIDQTVSLPTPSSTPQPILDDAGTSTALQKARASLNLHRARQPTPSLLRRMDNVSPFDIIDFPASDLPAFQRFCTHLLMYFPYWIEQHLKQLESSQPLPYPLSSFSAAPFSRLTQTHARWIFALLSRVDEQITSDEMSNLRSLARACISIIKDLNKSKGKEEVLGESSLGVPNSPSSWEDNPSQSLMDERACWVLVAAIAEFWGQKDLWLDAESMLKGL